MKHKGIILLLAVACSLVFLSNKIPQQGEVVQKALPKFKSEIVKDFDQLLIKTSKFKSAVEKHKDSTALSNEELTTYYDVRKAFKMVEAVLEYMDKENYDDSLNGDFRSPNFQQVEGKEKKGLKLIDELMFDKYFDQNKHQELYQLLDKFHYSLKKYMFVFSSINLDERQIFESYRYNVIRIAALSITGYDTQGSFHGIEDAKNQLTAIEKYMGYFGEELMFTPHQKYFDEFKFLTKRGLELLNANNDFNNFDRLQFLREVVNPLYKNLRDMHYMLEYATWNNVETNIKHHLDYNAEFIFSKDFFDKYSFVDFEEDSLFQRKARLGKIVFHDPLFSNLNTYKDTFYGDVESDSTAYTDNSHVIIRVTHEPNKPNLPYDLYAGKNYWDLTDNISETQENLDELTSMLKKSQMYKFMFELAFQGTKDTISSKDIDHALKSYILTLGKFDSSFDAFMRYETFDLSDDAQKGFNLFAGKAACATCHFMPTFSNTLPPLFQTSTSFTALDSTANTAHNLRNIANKRYLMHTYEYPTLASVIQAYNQGKHAEIEHLPNRSQLSETEIMQIVVFLQSLTSQNTDLPFDENTLPRDFAYPYWNRR